MSKISEVFNNKKCLVAYLTAGDPALAQTEEYIKVLADSGADLIEIGIPFSDPVAEGEVISAAMERALKNGVSIDKLFEMVARVKKEIKVPLAFMTYINPVFSYGYDKFFKKCKETGVDAIIVPDMPFEEQGEIKEYTDKYSIDIITLIAPTSKERIAKLAKNSKGFIYLVSSMGVTGVRAKITTDIPAIVSEIKKVTDTPVAVGFGISTPEQASDMLKSADGVIIGSAIVKIIAEHKDKAAKPLADYIKSIKRGF